MQQREPEIVVISDVHLGTYGCHAKELLQYLKSIKPKMLILNGDIIDIWQFSKRYWPSSHMQIVKHITGLIANDVPVYYIPGNHDEMLRKFKDFQMGSFKITNKLLITVNNSKLWIFHGDVFDVVMQHSRWLAKLGAIGYDTLILINNVVNFISKKCKGGNISLSKRIKNSVKGAVKFVSNFETTATNIAAENGYQYVVCGHIHQPEIRTMATKFGPVIYMNSGDWVENLTALEYEDGKWKLYKYAEDELARSINLKYEQEDNKSAKDLMNILMEEMNLKEKI
jgi:UDP-2,3-diacylglucosamine pyrophosphatase LpxH